MDYKLAKLLAIAGVNPKMLSDLTEVNEQEYYYLRDNNRALALAFQIRNSVLLTKYESEVSKRFVKTQVTPDKYEEYLRLTKSSNKYFSKNKISEDWRLVNHCTVTINHLLEESLVDNGFTKEESETVYRILSMPIFKSKEQYSSLLIRSRQRKPYLPFHMYIYSFVESSGKTFSDLEYYYNTFAHFLSITTRVPEVERNSYFIDSSNLSVLEVTSLLVKLSKNSATNNIYLIAENRSLINWKTFAGGKVTVIDADSSVTSKNSGDILLAFLLGAASEKNSEERFYVASNDSDFSPLVKMLGDKLTIILGEEENSVSKKLVQYYKDNDVSVKYVNQILGVSVKEFVSNSKSDLKEANYLLNL